MPKCDFYVSLQSNFIEIILRHGCPLVNVLHIFGTPFPKNISRGLLLNINSSLNMSLLRTSQGSLFA